MRGKEIVQDQPKEKAKTDNLLEYIFDYIHGATNKPMTRVIDKGIKSGQPYTKRAVQSFLNTLNTLIAFRGGEGLTQKDILSEGSYKLQQSISFNEIDNALLNSFKTYLTGKGLSLNFYGSHIKYIKKFMKAAMNEGYHNNTKFEEFTKATVKTDSIALSHEQLTSLLNYNFSDNECFDNARDLFLLGCYTGLRYSDYSRLAKANISGKYIDILTKKTNEQVVIPIMKDLQKILDKYKTTESGFPRIISDVKLNVYIKQICKIVGENSDPSFLKKDGVKKEMLSGKQIEVLPLYERISTHTGRRSFATMAVKLEIPKEIIMRITGHKTASAFDLYVGINTREYASMMAEHFTKFGM